MKEKLIKAMQLIATEESYIRNGYSLNEEDAAALAEANDLLNEILESLPTECEVECEDEDMITDALSDTYGYLVNSYNIA